MRAITTAGYVGLLRPAPGTWGSALAVGLAVALHALGGFPTLLLATLLSFALGLWAVARDTAGAADPDRSEIVIDEVVGQWVTLLPFSGLLWAHGIGGTILPWPGLLGGFLFFRLFDIWKPWPIRVFDRMKTPFGVMADDVVAGVFAALTLLATGGIAHGFLR